MARRILPFGCVVPFAVVLAACKATGTAHSESSEQPTTPAPVASPAAPAEDGAIATLEVGGATIRVWSEDGPADLAPFVAWVRNSAEVVAAYHQGFPVPELDVTLNFNAGGRVGFGQHWDGRKVRVRVGRRTDQDELDDDWVMIHEMHHCALPDLVRRHSWMQEGLSTYLEPVSRVRAHQYEPARMWSHFYGRLPSGLPKWGDKGLDNTRTWGRVYWGGTMYWFLADVLIRKETKNQLGLDDALAGIQAAGGDARADWSTEQVVRLGDEATGTTVLADLYEELANNPGSPDLVAIFADLGVTEVSGKIHLDDDAPLAEIRRGITGR